MKPLLPSSLFAFSFRTHLWIKTLSVLNSKTRAFQHNPHYLLWLDILQQEFFIIISIRNALCNCSITMFFLFCFLSKFLKSVNIKCISLDSANRIMLQMSCFLQYSINISIKWFTCLQPYPIQKLWFFAVIYLSLDVCNGIVDWINTCCN